MQDILTQLLIWVIKPGDKIAGGDEKEYKESSLLPGTPSIQSLPTNSISSKLSGDIKKKFFFLSLRFRWLCVSTD